MVQNLLQNYNNIDQWKRVESPEINSQVDNQQKYQGKSTMGERCAFEMAPGQLYTPMCE